jgi:hypothetical protein
MYQAFSYANSNISDEVCRLQKQVFEKLNLPVTQIKVNADHNTYRHGDFLNEISKNTNSKYVIFFDVDCIPLTSNLYDIIINELEKEQCIIGIEQKCNCNNYNHIYAGPACLAFSTSLYKDLNYPSLIQNERSDVAEELTWICEEKKIKIKYFNVSSSETPMWHLKENTYFGIGTTYSFNDEEVLYHQFNIRSEHTPFIKKCNEFLKKYENIN